ncbi:MAG: glycosyltransferase [bacterium]
MERPGACGPRLPHPLDPGPGAPWDILFVGYGDWLLWNWDGFRTRSAQLFRFLARSKRVARVFVLNEPVYLRGGQAGFAVPRWERFKRLPLRGGGRRESEKVILLEPSRFLVGPDRMKRPWTARMLAREMAAWKARPVLWIANVHKAWLMREVPAAVRVFDAIDDWDAVPEYRKQGKNIRAGYGRVLQDADLIYTVSRPLLAKFRRRARTPEVHHLPNGVDLDLFSTPAEPPLKRRAARRLRQPILTYVGVLSERFDMELMGEVARQWPRCTIRLVGPVGGTLELRLRRLRGLPNVEWTGLVRHERVPDLLRESDVLLIPHRESPLSLSMDPLKLYEYLTTGLPVVTTPVPPVEEYARWLYIGAASDFPRLVGEALAEADRAQAEALWRGRIEVGKKQGWEIRIGRILSDLDRLRGSLPSCL